MGIRFVDGFDSYGSTSDVLTKWGRVETPWTWGAAAGRTGAGGMSAATTGGGRLRVRNQIALVPGATNVISLGYWLKVSTTPGALANLVHLVYDDTSTIGGSIRVTTGGLLTHYDGSTLKLTGSTNIADNAWHWVENYIGVRSTAVTQRCDVDGVSQWNTTATMGDGSSTLGFVEFVSLAGVTTSLDDTIVYDSTGSGFQPATVYPLGAKQIVTLRPNGDDVVQFTPSAGANNWANIDEANPDMTDYVSDGNPTHQDLYTYSDITTAPANVSAVVLNALVCNPNPGTIRFSQQAKSSTSVTYGVITPAPSNPRIMQEPIYLDPNGNVAWTGTSVNAASFGIKTAGYSFSSGFSSGFGG